MIRIERAAAFQPQTETIYMVQEGDHLQWALFPFSSPVLGAPETSPSCISSSLTCARHSAWSCHCNGGSIGRWPEQNTKVAGLVWASFCFFFLDSEMSSASSCQYFGNLLGFVFLMWFSVADAPAAKPLAASEPA